MGIKNYEIYDKLTPDPAIEKIEKIRKNTKESKFQTLLALEEAVRWMYANISANSQGFPRF